MKKEKKVEHFVPAPLDNGGNFQLIWDSEIVHVQVNMLRCSEVVLLANMLRILKPNCYTTKNLKDKAEATIAIPDVDPSPSEADWNTLKSETSKQRSLSTTRSFSGFYAKEIKIG